MAVRQRPHRRRRRRDREREKRKIKKEKVYNTIEEKGRLLISCQRTRLRVPGELVCVCESEFVGRPAAANAANGRGDDGETTTPQAVKPIITEDITHHNIYIYIYVRVCL